MAGMTLCIDTAALLFDLASLTFKDEILVCSFYNFINIESLSKTIQMDRNTTFRAIN